MEKKLSFILNEAINWLKFSEAKNAAIIAFIAVTFPAVIQIAMSPNRNDFIFYYALNYLIFSGFSLFVALISFAPKTKNIWIWKSNKIKKSDNHFFFAQLTKYDEKSLISAISNKYQIESKNIAIEIDIANQVIQNSKIALKKYKYFNFALWLLFMGIFSLPVGLISHSLFNPNDQAL
jgi:Pycsar effector protein